ncbi:TIGR02710 family CRISPR-associated CARF protein [Micromonospora sp. NPDC006431]|uniref:TIGR02710 family CRISPR-associated CARF protein n=1 Tax=Micromonospora sp. NPDC006431 TaxID=3364235 RepID=UPI0036A1F8DD
MGAIQHDVKLRRILRGEDRWDDGSPSDQATSYFLSQMLDEVVTRIRRENPALTRPVDLLISMSGFSPLTTILAYELIRPTRLLVIYSAQADASIDFIGKHVVGGGRLRYQDFMHRPVQPTDPQGVYREVKDVLARYDTPDGRKLSAIIDITGGKKVMSAAAALAAWQLNLDLCYIDGEYDPEFRRVVPGDERPLLLANPTALFGEQEMAAALETFRSGAFDSAHAQYHDLCEQIAEPTRARFMRSVSALYRAWCDLDLSRLQECIKAVDVAQQSAERELTHQTSKTIADQLDFLRELTTEPPNPAALLVCFFVLGKHYRKIGRQDFAALLFYRTIEGCLARHLELTSPGFACKNPDYSLLGSLDTVANGYQRALQATGGRPSSELPSSISLIQSATLLYSLGDEFAAKAKLNTPSAIANLRDLAEIRNNSVLAHGYRTITPEQSERLRGRAEHLLSIFWQLHGTDTDVRALCGRLQFISNDR